MQYLDINFGRSIAHLITSDIDQKEIYALLALHEHNLVTAGITLTSYAEMFIQKKLLVTYEYPLTKVLLFLCKYKNNKLTLFIYDKFIIYVSYNFAEELYLNNGTLFNGVLNGSYYIITDIIQKSDIYTKLKRINFIIRELYNPIPGLDTHIIKLTDYVNCNYLYSLCTDYKGVYLDKLKICNITITDLNKIYIQVSIPDIIAFFSKNICIKNDNIPNTQIDIDIVIMDESSNISMKMYKTDKPDIYLLWHDNKYVGMADVPSLEISSYILSIFPPKYYFINVQCIKNKKTNRWRPIKCCI